MSNVLVERGKQLLKTRPDLETALTRYADELGVSLDHVILGSLQTIAEMYNEITGDGSIPSLRPFTK